MLKKYFRSINARVLLISTLPLILGTLVLTWFMVFPRHADIEQGLMDLGGGTADFIASAADFGMYTEDKAYLKKIASGIQYTESIVGVSFLDMKKKLIAYQGQNISYDYPEFSECWENGIHKSNLYWYFCKQVVSTASNLDDYNDQDDSFLMPTEHGWVLIVVSNKLIQQHQQRIIHISLVISSLVAIFTIWMALRIGRSISSPVQLLARQVKDIDNSDLDADLSIFDTEEVYYLAHNIFRMAKAVRESKSHLQQRIDEATTQLTATMTKLSMRNIELERTQEELTSAMAAQEAFLARMSHELRTPLTAVIGFSRLLEETPLTDEQEEYSRNIIYASSLLLATIDDILDYSKLLSSGLSLEKIEFNLRTSMEDLVSMHTSNAYEKSIELVILIDTDVPEQLLGDSMRINQVVNNLLGNAIKFTEKGEVVLHISFIDQDEDKCTIEFSYTRFGYWIGARATTEVVSTFFSS